MSRFSNEALPAAWASALINDDWSGLEFDDPAEAERCREWLKSSGMRAIDVSESYVDQYMGITTQVADFTCEPNLEVDGSI